MPLPTAARSKRLRLKTKPMRPRVSFILIALVSLLSGCSTPASTASNAPTLLVVLRVAGGGAPTSAQAAKVHQAIAPAMAHAGLQLAKSLDEADYILTATFKPDAENPDGGTFAVNRIERHQRKDTGASREQLQEAQQRLSSLDAWAAAHSAPDYSR
jgi:hypothetical protein